MPEQVMMNRQRAMPELRALHQRRQLRNLPLTRKVSNFHQMRIGASPVRPLDLACTSLQVADYDNADDEDGSSLAGMSPARRVNLACTSSARRAGISPASRLHLALA